MPWSPQDIIIGQHGNSNYKRDNGEMLKGIITKKYVGIKVKKLTDHPVRVGRYPKSDGYIVTNLTHILPGSECNDDRDEQRWNDHHDT